jgi:CTP synthase
VELPDAYISINESFKHAGAMNNCRVDVHFIHSEDVDDTNYKDLLKGFDGIVVAPGFGDRGIEGKILAAKFARENNVPFFGICLGLQCAVIEFARNVLHLEKAHSTEMFLKTPDPVIDLMEDQKGVTEKGGTMRLGAYPCVIKEGTHTAEAYGQPEVSERHRHRYEFNNRYQEAFEKAGMISAGINPDTQLVEIMEIPSHKWFVGVQFHPEYSSTVLKPHPLFVNFIKATIC